jgi:hypothetical protein
MTIQRENAEVIKSMVDTAIRFDKLLQEIYKNLNTTIRNEADGSCILQVSELACCRCSPDGSVWLVNDPDKQPFVGNVPVLLPLDRDSFLIAMLYIADLNALHILRRKRLEKTDGRDDGFGMGFGSGGFIN